jgi:hypothetical protein
MPVSPPPPRTPDGRYILVRGRLWRATRPDLPPDRAADLRVELGRARADIAAARRRRDCAAERDARQRVHVAKLALGERGPVWWTDGQPDYNRHLARNTLYADWAARFPA